MAGNGAIGDFGRAVTDEGFLGDMSPGLPFRPGSRYAQCAPRTKMQNKLAFERSTALDVESLVDRLVRDTHGLIIREIDFEPVGDLLRTPRCHPLTVAPVRLVPARPLRRPRAGDDTTV